MSQLEKHGKGIILMHDFKPHTAEAMPELIRQLKASGYKVVQMVPKGEVTTVPKYDENCALHPQATYHQLIRKLFVFGAFRTVACPGLSVPRRTGRQSSTRLIEGRR